MTEKSDGKDLGGQFLRIERKFEEELDILVSSWSLKCRKIMCWLVNV
jgi:hypothetical protein